MQYTAGWIQAGTKSKVQPVLAPRRLPLADSLPAVTQLAGIRVYRCSMRASGEFKKYD